jgi:RND family efflux transporter MFP subunit
MKKTVYISIIALSIIGCQSGAEYGDDIVGKRTALADKKAMLKTLESEIKTLESEILVLDPPKQKNPILVNGETLENQTFERYISIQGIVESDDLVNVSAEMGGRIKTLRAEEGDYVRKGQTIATLDMETLEKQIEEVKTSLSLATTVYERQKRLWEQNIGSEIQYLQAKNNKDRLDKSLETLDSQVAKRNIYAPISGYVDRKFLSAGEMAAPGVPIVNILDASKVKITADIPESYLGKIKSNDVVDIHFPALNKSIQKKISQISRTIDPANRTFQIEIHTSNKDNTLKPNLLAEVRFMDYKKENSIVAPVDYILEEVNGNKFVYIALTKDNKMIARKTYVQLGESYNGLVIIVEGLAAGDILVTDGSRNVAENDPIIIQNN